MKVSIIMGIYNCENTLDESLQSIFNQTFQNWEFIICNDGSTDNSYSIVEKYAKNDKRIKLIQNEKNMGLNYTLNHCLKYAQGEYIARMDGDDISLPTRLQKEVEFLDSHPDYSIVSTPMIYFDERGEFAIGKSIKIPTKYDAIKGTPFCHAPCMVRKRAYDAVKGYSIDKKTLRVEDYDLWIRMMSLGFRGYNLSEPLYKMRDDRDAYSRRKYKYRINEAYVKYKAIKLLKLPLKYSVFILRPLIVGCIPSFLYKKLHSKKIQGGINI